MTPDRINGAIAPATLDEAVIAYSDPDLCEAEMRAARWPGGAPRCIRCDAEGAWRVSTRGLIRCPACRAEYTVRTGTAMGHSKVPAGPWLVAVWAVACADPPVSTADLAGVLDLRWATAASMVRRIRAAIDGRRLPRKDRFRAALRRVMRPVPADVLTT